MGEKILMDPNNSYRTCQDDFLSMIYEMIIMKYEKEFDVHLSDFGFYCRQNYIFII